MGSYVSPQIYDIRFLELAMSLLDFSPRILLGTFSILLEIKTYIIDSFIYTNLIIIIFLKLWNNYNELFGNEIWM